MRIIKKMADYMEDELDGCIEYAKDALEYQYTRAALSKNFYQMAQAEYGHYQLLHESVVKLIEEIKQQGKNYPQKMLDKWESQHRKFIEKAEEAQMYLNMYK